MVNFFIGRPIFATVLALLMLLIGGICIFVLPISLYPDIAPPQVQVTTTYTGADAQTVAETVTTPIEQQINGVKGHDLLQLRQHQQRPVEHHRHVRRRLRRRTSPPSTSRTGCRRPRPSLPPEVKQYGVTIKKTSTDMVCVVNLISPDGRYDATFLDNYGQIYVARRAEADPGRQRRERASAASTRCGSGSTRTAWPTSGSRPTEVIQAIQQENNQAAAGKIGGQPVPDRAGLRVPDHAQGAALEGRASSRRSSSAATTTARSSASRTSPASSSTRRTTRRPASSTASRPARIPIYQYADANALDIVEQVRRGDGPRSAQSFPDGLEYRIVYDTTEYVDENITEVAAHAARGVPAGADRRVRVPPGLPRHDHPDARDPGLAGRHVRDDGRLRLLDQHADAVRAGPGDRPGGRRRDHRRRERREVPRARAGGRWRRPGRRWPRSRRRSSRSRWCWRRCSSRWRSSRA